MRFFDRYKLSEMEELSEFYSIRRSDLDMTPRIMYLEEKYDSKSVFDVAEIEIRRARNGMVFYCLGFMFIGIVIGIASILIPLGG